MKGGGEHPLTVAVRIRPLNESELVSGGSQVAYKVDDQMAVLLDPSDDPDDILRANRSREKRYLFHRVFDDASSQEEVYQATTRFLIDSVLGGYNGTVFAYGATGAGKTYTMLGTEHEPGIYVRALNDLFTLVQEKEEETSYKVSMSYLEIYNEMVRDLLNPASGYLEMREDAKGGVQVSGLSEVSTTSTAEIMELLQRGNLERTQEPTKANKTSSRSHAVLQVTVKQRSRGSMQLHQDAAAAPNVHDQLRIGRLFLVDLAGSERAANTQNRGKRMVEGAHINRSLLALGNCINALSEMKGGATSYKYVNYRDSKLTRLLKDALGGNCRTVMIAHVAPASMHFDESRNTLVYADRAKHIKNRVRRNVEDVSYHLTQYTTIISELKDEIARLQSKLTASSTVRPSILAVQNEVMRTTNAHEFFKLKEQLMLVFKEQLALRRSLMELDNSSVEVGLEVDRHQLIVTEWEAESAAAKQRREHDADLEKQLEVSGESYDDVEPDAVRAARGELAVLMGEQHQTEKQRASVAKELAIIRQKAAALEENLPKYISSEEQREMMALLLRVHELEIENTEVQSELYLKEHEGSRKELLISQYHHHKSLADEIIAHQKELIRTHKVPVPAELENAYDTYTAMAARAATAEHNGDESLISIRSSQQHAVLSSLPPKLPPLSQGVPSSTVLATGRVFVPASHHVRHRQGNVERIKERDAVSEERWTRQQQRGHHLGPDYLPAPPAAQAGRDGRLGLAPRATAGVGSLMHRREGGGGGGEKVFEQRRHAPASLAQRPNLVPPSMFRTLPREKTLYSLSIRSSSTESLAVPAATTGEALKATGATENAAASHPEAARTRNIAVLAAAKRRLQQQDQLRVQHVDGGAATTATQAGYEPQLPQRVVPLLSVSDGYLNRTFISIASGGDAASVATGDLRSEARTPSLAALPDGFADGGIRNHRPPEQHGSVRNRVSLPTAAASVGNVWSQGGGAYDELVEANTIQKKKFEELQVNKDLRSLRRKSLVSSSHPAEAVLQKHRAFNPPKDASSTVLKRHPSGRVARRHEKTRRSRDGRRRRESSALKLVASRPPLEVRRPPRAHLPGQRYGVAQPGKQAHSVAYGRSLPAATMPAVRVRLIQQN